MAPHAQAGAPAGSVSQGPDGLEQRDLQPAIEASLSATASGSAAQGGGAGGAAGGRSERENSRGDAPRFHFFDTA